MNPSIEEIRLLHIMYKPEYSLKTQIHAWKTNTNQHRPVLLGMKRMNIKDINCKSGTPWWWSSNPGSACTPQWFVAADWIHRVQHALVEGDTLLSTFSCFFIGKLILEMTVNENGLLGYNELEIEILRYKQHCETCRWIGATVGFNEFLLSWLDISVK